MVTIIQGDYKKIKDTLRRNFKTGYFDFNFTYTEENEVFREINRFVWESKHLMTRFKNRYYGPIAVCVSEWNDEVLNCYFDAFMYFIKDIYSDKNICFYLEAQITNTLLNKIKEFFPRTKIIDFQIKNTPERNTIGFVYTNCEAREEK